MSDQRLLLIGAGEMIELAATHFAARKPAVDHGRQPHARARRAARAPLRRRGDHAERAARAAARFDIIVTCTASTLPIIGKGLLERAVKARRHAPIFIVDLAVPRDVEPEAASSTTCSSTPSTTSPRSCKDNLQIRREAVAQAEQMIADADGALPALAARAAASCRRSPRCTAHHDALRSAELERARKHARARRRRPTQVLEALARGLTNKLLHRAARRRSTRAGEAERAELIALFSRIYGLSDRPNPGLSRSAHDRVAVALLRVSPSRSFARASAVDRRVPLRLS